VGNWSGNILVAGILTYGLLSRTSAKSLHGILTSVLTAQLQDWVRCIPPPPDRRAGGVRVSVASGLQSIAHLRQQKEVSHPAARTVPSAKFAITMRQRGKEQTSDIELPSRAIETLALEAMSRDLDIARLIGQILAAAINKNMIQKILR
jgi:hypothetical protein